MRRQNGDSTMASSSIALLQERFKELQRTREKRQEKELLKLFSSPESEHRRKTGSPDDPSGMHFGTVQPETTLPSRAPALQDSLLSLRLNSQGNNTNISGNALWPYNTTGSSTGPENSDVDTSLHL